jgi:hypothetical protein
VNNKLSRHIATSTVALLAGDILKSVARVGRAISFPRYRRKRRQYVVVRMLGGIIREYWRGPYYRDGHKYDRRIGLAYRHTTFNAANSAIAGCGLATYSSTLMVVEIDR